MRAQGFGPSEAFDITRDRIRKLFYELRNGVKWQGKTYTIDAEYCTKVEFHADEEGWPHFHVIWLTRRFVPAEMLADLWGHGRTNVKRITNKDFHYLLKYVCKSGEVPEWVQDRNRLRIFQPSRGFLLPNPDAKPPQKKSDEAPKKRTSTTIRERLQKWEHLALMVVEEVETGIKTMRELNLWSSFNNIFDRLVYAVALDGRYLGNGKIKINNERELYPWVMNLQQSTPLPD